LPKDKPDEDLPTPKESARVGKGCIVDKRVGKWGPYRYLVTKHKGKQHWKYLGRTDKFIKASKEVEE